MWIYLEMKYRTENKKVKKRIYEHLQWHSLSICTNASSPCRHCWTQGKGVGDAIWKLSIRIGDDMSLYKKIVRKPERLRKYYQGAFGIDKGPKDKNTHKFNK